MAGFLKESKTVEGRTFLKKSKNKIKELKIFALHFVQKYFLKNRFKRN